MISIILFIDYVCYLPVRIARNLYTAWADILLLIINESNWEAVNSKCYRRTNFYSQTSLSLGLYLWEKNCIEKFFPKAPAKILILAAGSGREASVLLKQGYKITSCEIVDNFRESLVELHKIYKQEEPSVFKLSFNDVINSDRSHLKLGAEAVIIGYGGISHLANRKLQVALLSKIKEISPDAVVMFSWLKLRKRSKWQRLWRVCLYRFTSKRITKFRGYDYGCGPITYANSSYMRAIIKDAGLELLHFDDLSAYPHAVCRSIK